MESPGFHGDEIRRQHRQSGAHRTLAVCRMARRRSWWRDVVRPGERSERAEEPGWRPGVCEDSGGDEEVIGANTEMMKWTGILICLLALRGSVGSSQVVTRAKTIRPNVVFFLADDLGVMDIGANNPKTFYSTPNIDALAKSGMRFTCGYSACPVCSPTRASIMTGKYPTRTGVTDYIGRNRAAKMIPAANADHLRLEEVTIAERLRAAGYATFFAGKWHLGAGEFSPNAQGFGPDLEGRGQ